MTRVTACVMLCVMLASNARAERFYEGEVVPRDFLAIYAPMNTLHVPGWGSSSNSIQLIEVQPEDQEVLPGQTIAQFKFGQDRARQYLDSHMADLKARRDEEQLSHRKSIQDLENQVAKLQIEREKLALDKLLATSLARIKQKLLDYDHQLKSLETDSAAQQLEAGRKELAWNQQTHDARIGGWQTNFTIFDETKARYTVKAPVSGRLFYPVLEQANRKVRRGDDMNSGTHFLSIVRSDRAQLRFFVPEADFARVRVGDAVTVGPDGPSPFRATVTRVDAFAQSIGDARKNFRLPDAWEKCFVVLADVEAPFSKIAKKDVTVRLAR